MKNVPPVSLQETSGAAVCWHKPPRTHARPSDTLERLFLLSTMPRASRSKAADQDTDMVADEVVRPRCRSRRRSFPRN